MVLRVCTDGLSASSQKRAKSLDKWKTDWFHEISNLFTLTTDQVTACVNEDDIALAASCGSAAANKYHGRNLQNRAKMSMVVSLVERYVKGELSVERNLRNDVTLNDIRVGTPDEDDLMTPWTMVRPEEVCPALKREAHQPRYVFDAENTIGSEQPLSFPEEEDITFDLDSPLNDIGKLPDTDLLAQACESLNKYTPKALEPDNYSLERQLSQSIPSSMPSLQANKLYPSENNVLSQIPTNVNSYKGGDLNDKKRKRTSDCDKTTNFTSPFTSSSSSSKMKLVESIPATLPDGRVVRIELSANNSNLESRGGKITHVLLPMSNTKQIGGRAMATQRPEVHLNTTKTHMKNSFGTKIILKKPTSAPSSQQYARINPAVSLRNIAPLPTPQNTAYVSIGKNKSTTALQTSTTITHTTASTTAQPTSFQRPEANKRTEKKSTESLKNELQAEGKINLEDALDNLDDLSEIMAELDSPNAEEFYDNLMKNFVESDGSLSPESTVEQQVEQRPQTTKAKRQNFRGKTGPQDNAKERKSHSPVDGELNTATNKILNGTKKAKKRSADYDATNPFYRPPLPYNIIIFLAFRQLEFCSLTVQQLYKMITNIFPYFKHAHSNWQNAIRHQLCCCKVYEKVPVFTTLPDEVIDRSGGKSAWRIRDNSCIEKLKNDTLVTLGKPDIIPKIKRALSAEYDFMGMFGDNVVMEEPEIDPPAQTVIEMKQRSPSPVSETNNLSEDNLPYETSPDSYVETLSPSALEKANLDFSKYIADFQTINQQNIHAASSITS